MRLSEVFNTPNYCLLMKFAESKQFHEGLRSIGPFAVISFSIIGKIVEGLVL